jgi:hypothetical protein
MRVIDFDELRALAAQNRNFVQTSQDQARALRAIVNAYDVVLGIFPSPEGTGLHVVKGDDILRYVADNDTAVDYSYTAIAVHTREQAMVLQTAVAA